MIREVFLMTIIVLGDGNVDVYLYIYYFFLYFGGSIKILILITAPSPGIIISKAFTLVALVKYRSPLWWLHMY